MNNSEDIRLLNGDKGCEFELPAYLESPTWIIDELWDAVNDVGQKALKAYMLYCKTNKFPHSSLLGLDILITGISDGTGNKIIDIHPTILEGPCCNSYPACPNFWAYRLYKNMVKKGLDPDRIEYPTHPTKILDKMVNCFLSLWKFKGHAGLPTIGIFTRPYQESEEESAHIVTLEGFKRAGLRVFRITPREKPFVKNGKLHINDIPVDMVYRRIERIHVPIFYGETLGNAIINDTPGTDWINPWKVDDLRSKTIEEKCFRQWETLTGEKIPRPVTLLGKEITVDNVRKLANHGGYALKKWNSTGGKGVFLHLYEKSLGNIGKYMYERYDGRHMIVLNSEVIEKELAIFNNFAEDAAIQQLRLIDSRNISKGKLVYDTRINYIYDSLNDRWDVLSGISRSVPCGKTVENGNSLLTNISSGAEVAPLIIGYSKDKSLRKDLVFGPMAKAILESKDHIEIPN